MINHEARREAYQQLLDMELLTERRLDSREWFRQARDAARGYARQFPSNPYALGTAWLRMDEKTFSIAEVRRATKEGWVL